MGRGEVSVRDVYEMLKAKRGLAHTTVITVMGRLAEKELLHRRKEGGVYFYRAVTSKEAFT